MTKKIDVNSLSDFNAAHYLGDYNDIKAYMRIVKEEGDPAAFSQALNKVFMALGASVVADALDIDIGQIWDAQDNPSDHLDIQQQIGDLIENGLMAENTANNPHRGGNFEDFLREEGIYDEVTARAVRRVIAALLKQRI
jgi:DNA-binding phage protein